MYLNLNFKWMTHPRSELKVDGFCKLSESAAAVTAWTLGAGRVELTNPPMAVPLIKLVSRPLAAASHIKRGMQRKESIRLTALTAVFTTFSGPRIPLAAPFPLKFKFR